MINNVFKEKRMDLFLQKKIINEKNELEKKLYMANKKMANLEEELAFYKEFFAKTQIEEELKGKQHKIDANKNNKIDAEEFKILSKKKINESHNLDQLKKLNMIKLRGLKSEYENKIDTAKTTAEKNHHKDELKNINRLLNKDNK